MKKVSLYIFLLIFSLGNSFAQKMTLKECVDLALKNNLTYRETLLNIESSKADVNLAKSLKMPQVGAYVGQSTNIGRSIDRSTNSYIDQLYTSNYLGLQFSVPIFNGFQIQNQVQRNTLLQESNQKLSEANRNKLIVNTLQAYIQVIGTQELVDVAQQQVATSKLQVERINKQVAVGTVGQTVLFDIKSQLANDEFALVTAKNNNVAARLSLFQLMNQTPSRSTIFEPIKDENLTKVDFSINEIYEKATANLPDVQGAELRVKSFDNYIKYVKANTLPTLSLSGSYGTFFASSNSQLKYFDQLDANRSGSVGLSLNIPILGKMQNQPRLQAANVQRLLAENQLNITKLQLHQTIEQVYQNLQAASERFSAASEQVNVLEQNVAAQESRLNAGTLSLVEYTLAKTNYARALANKVQAKYEYILQEKVMGFYQNGEFKVE